ncbi:MAG: type II toxin-antitoxin system RelE/ParE family toxin [Pseudomonadota bacterium]
MKRAEWTLPAQADVARIDDFYQDLSPDFADRLGAAAFKAARFLAEHPRAGSQLDGDVRKWRITAFEYVLVYRPSPKGVEILRMHHMRENWRRVPD